MSAPVCSVHGTAMRENQRGDGYYCPRKNPDGSWCKERSKTAPPKPAESGQAGVEPGSSTDNDVALKVAALGFAAAVWGPSDPTMHDEILVTATKAYRVMKAIT